MDRDVDFRLRVAVLNELKTIGVEPQRLSRMNKRKSSQALKTADPAASFGVPLSVVVRNNGIEKNGLFLPGVVVRLVEFLRERDLSTEGLFRICGSASRMKKIQAAINAGKEIEGATIHDAAGLLKLFVREMPEPLLTFRLYSSFVQAFSISDPDVRQRAIFLLCLELPKQNLHLTMYLMSLLHDIAENNSKMSASNLSAIFTPNIIRPLDGDVKTGTRASTTTELELTNHSNCVGVIEALIVHSDQIGVVPEGVEDRVCEIEDEEVAHLEYIKRVENKPSFFSRLLCTKKKPSTTPPSLLKYSKSNQHDQKQKPKLTSKATLALIHGVDDLPSNRTKVMPKRADIKKQTNSEKKFGKNISNANITTPLSNKVNTMDSDKENDVGSFPAEEKKPVRKSSTKTKLMEREGSTVTNSDIQACDSFMMY